jgi:hypothetical protein
MMPRRRGADDLCFAASSGRVDVGDTSFRRCRPPGANLSCESGSRLAVMDDILIRGGQVIDGTATGCLPTGRAPVCTS